MKFKSIIRTILLFGIILATITVSAQVERDPNNKRGGKRDGAVKDKEASMERIKTKIESINAEMAKFIISGNVNQIMRYYTTDAVILPNYNVKMSGKAAIKKNWDESFKSGLKFKEIIFKTQSIEKAGNYFYEIGEYQMTMTVPGVPQDVTDISKSLVIWEKQGKEFKIKVEIWNTNVNPMTKFMKMGEEKEPEGEPGKDKN